MIPATLFTTALFYLILHLPSVLAFGHVPNSPCTSVCSGNSSATLANDVVCFNDDFFHNAEGEAFYNCVACELNSTAVDTANNQTDIEWALYNLRYTLSECMFGFPERRISISNPCVVTCEPLADAVGYQLSNDSATANPDLDFCTAAVFDDHDINNCAFCYGLIPQQLFIANFLQALHIACINPPASSLPFYPGATTIFNTTLIPSVTASTLSSSSSSSALHGWRLALAIALPTVAGVLFIVAACTCCFIYTRRRRRRMAETGRMSRLRNSWEGAATYIDGPVDAPVRMMGDGDREQEMQTIVSPRWATSQHQQMGVAAEQQQGLPTAIVGPGEGQVQDHMLHEQYFGTPTHPLHPTEEEIGVARSSHGPWPAQHGLGFQGEDYRDHEIVAGPSGTNEVSSEEGRRL